MQLGSLLSSARFRRTLALVSVPALGLHPTLGLVGGDLSAAGIAVVIGLLVICLGIHEAAHALVALWCGDPTARDLGRITLDPRPHIDPFQTILLPLMLYLTTGFVFGGAKPVPVNMLRLRKPIRDMSLVAIAGPLSNFLLAILFAFVLGVLVKFNIYRSDQAMVEILKITVHLNLLLAAFNLMPIPPLDGSRVMTWLLPAGLRRPYMELERFGLLIIFGLILFVPAFFDAVRWTMDTLMGLVVAIVDPALNLLHMVF
jgi:Zn-dependent protease